MLWRLFLSDPSVPSLLLAIIINKPSLSRGSAISFHPGRVSHCATSLGLYLALGLLGLVTVTFSSQPECFVGPNGHNYE